MIDVFVWDVGIDKERIIEWLEIKYILIEIY